MDGKRTELIFILDKSGSMHGLEADTIGGFNSMIDKQKEGEGDVRVTTVTFNHRVDLVHDGVPVGCLPRLGAEDYVTGGTTALYDAVGKTLASVIRRIRDAEPEDRPDRVMVVITTDGMENASRTFTRYDIRDMIGRQRMRHGWEFIFLGANIDSVKTASEIGIRRERTASFFADREGLSAQYDDLKAVVQEYRSSGEIDPEWDRELKKEYNRRK